MQKAVPKPEAGATRSSSRPLKPPRPVYCLCRSGDTARFMIACDNCQEWFHGDCVSVTSSMADRILAYYCETCRKKNRRLSIQYKNATSPVQAATAADDSENEASEAKQPRRGGRRRSPIRQEAVSQQQQRTHSKSKEASIDTAPVKRAAKAAAAAKTPNTKALKKAAPALLTNGGEERRRRRGRRPTARPASLPPTDYNQQRIHDADTANNINHHDDGIEELDLVPDSDCHDISGSSSKNGIVVLDPPSLLSSPSAAAAAAAAVALGAVVSDVDEDDDDEVVVSRVATDVGGVAVGSVIVDADSLAVADEEMLLPAEDESATDDELETSGFRPPQLESDPEQDHNSMLDEDDFASTSVFRFPKRCGYCEACRLKVDCGRCEVCQAKKRYPSFKLDTVDCLARQCRTMAKLGGRLGSLPFPIQKRGRGRPSKASLSNEYFLYLSAGARPRTRRDEPGVGHQQQLSPSSAILQHHQRGVGADSQAIDTGRKRRHHHHQLQKHRHHHPTSDNGSLIVATPRPQFCTPYGLAYSDHSYCKHHASGGWQRQSPQPVSQVVSPVGSAAASAAATAAAASALVAAAMATSTASSQQFGHHQQQQQQRYSFGQLDLLAQQQAFYTLNDDTDNLEINWPEEAAA